MEEMVSWHNVRLFQKTNLLLDIQCGFFAGRSEVDHLVSLKTAVYEAFLQWQHFVAVFDLEKAYDTTWHH